VARADAEDNLRKTVVASFCRFRYHSSMPGADRIVDERAALLRRAAALKEVLFAFDSYAANSGVVLSEQRAGDRRSSASRARQKRRVAPPPSSKLIGE
jgi:hypothetical protein